MTAPQRFGAYHRISRLNGRDLDADSTVTDKDAFERMDGWAASRGLPKPTRYLDADVSGSTMERPELDRLLADLKAGVIDGIVVAQVDRLSRADVGDALAVVKQVLDIAPQGLVILDLGIDPSTEFGEFGLTILLGLGRMQWRRYKRQWTTAQDRATKRGVWIGPAPLGYTRTADGTLRLDRRTAPVVRDAFKIAAADGLHAAARHLEARAPSKRWRKSDVRRVLSNRAYLGEHHAGGAGHDPITTPSLFAAAQTLPQARRSNGDYPLSGIAVCEDGQPMVGALQTVRGTAYRRMRTGDGTCSISADKLELHVRSRVAERLGNARFLKLIEPVGKDKAEAALASAEASLLAHIDKVPPTSAGYGPGVVKWEAAIDAARAELHAVAETSARREQLPIADQLDDPEQLLRAVRAGVVSIVVRAGRGSVDDRVDVRFVGDDLDDRVGMLAA